MSHEPGSKELYDTFHLKIQLYKAERDIECREALEMVNQKYDAKVANLKKVYYERNGVQNFPMSALQSSPSSRDQVCC